MHVLKRTSSKIVDRKFLISISMYLYLLYNFPCFIFKDVYIFRFHYIFLIIIIFMNEY